MGSLNPPSFRFPFPIHDLPESAQQAHVFSFNAILDLQSANKELTAQIAALKSATPTPGTSTSTTTTVIENPFPGLGTKNDQTGNTAYTTQTGDNGTLLILNDAAAVAVGLNSVVSTPFFLFVTNFGAGTATLTPTSGLINGGASFPLPQNYFAVVVFDGTNWETSALLVIPSSAGPTAHEWIASYNATTGVFTLTQPDFSDISGTVAIGQLPFAFADGETPSGLINGVNVTFTLAHSPNPALSLILALNGVIQHQGVGDDYTLSGGTITFAVAPALGPILAWYRY